MEMLENLRQEVHQATLMLAAGAVLDSFRGGVSAFDRKRGLILTRPKTVDYLSLTDEDYLVVSARHGHVVEGAGEPVEELAAHVAIYHAFPAVDAVADTPSKYATMWAQAGCGIPCLGAFHADHFRGDIPLVEVSTEGEENFFARAGEAVGLFFESAAIDPMLVGGALIARAGPVTWAENAVSAARRAISLEKCAEMAFGTLILNGAVQSISPYAFGFSAARPLPKSVALPQKPRIRGLPDLHKSGAKA